MAKNKSISIQFDGLEAVLSQLDTISQQVEIGANEGVRKAVESTKELAIMLAPANDGQLRANIKANAHNLVGEIYVSIYDVPYVGYVYFGTGKYAKLEGKGKNSWYVPVSKVTKSVSKYGWQVQKGLNGMEDFYIVKGQKAKPFLEQALEATKLKNIDLLCEEVKIAIERSL